MLWAAERSQLSRAETNSASSTSSWLPHMSGRAQMAGVDDLDRYRAECESGGRADKRRGVVSCLLLAALRNSLSCAAQITILVHHPLHQLGARSGTAYATAHLFPAPAHTKLAPAQPSSAAWGLEAARRQRRPRLLGQRQRRRPSRRLPPLPLASARQASPAAPCCAGRVLVRCMRLQVPQCCPPPQPIPPPSPAERQREAEVAARLAASAGAAPQQAADNAGLVRSMNQVMAGMKQYQYEVYRNPEVGADQLAGAGRAWCLEARGTRLSWLLAVRAQVPPPCLALHPCPTCTSRCADRRQVRGAQAEQGGAGGGAGGAADRPHPEAGAGRGRVVRCARWASLAVMGCSLLQAVDPWQLAP